MADRPYDVVTTLLYSPREPNRGRHGDYSADDNIPQSGDRGRATYFSADTKKQSGVYVSAPSGSRHAARISKLCGTIHADAVQDLPARNAIEYGNERARIPPAEPVVEEIHDEEQHQQEQQHQHQHQQQHSSSSAWFSAATTTTAMTVAAAPPVVAPPRRAASVKVVRYEDESQLAYHSKSDRGELYVSAPQGSKEAMAFREVAKRAGEKKKRVTRQSAGDSSSLVVVREKGSWWWK